MNRLTLEEFKEAEKLPLIVVLDDVRSLYNVGSVFRSCDAFRVEAVYLCGITATPPNAEIHKTALGGEDSVDWEYFKTTEEAVEKLKQKGYFVYSIEQVEGSTKLQNLENPIKEFRKGSRGEAIRFFTLHSSLSTSKGLRRYLRQRSKGCEAEHRGYERWLPGDSTVWHQAFPECQRNSRHSGLGIRQTSEVINKNQVINTIIPDKAARLYRGFSYFRYSPKSVNLISPFFRKVSCMARAARMLCGS